MLPSALRHARGPLSCDFPAGLPELSGSFASLLPSPLLRRQRFCTSEAMGDGISSLISLNTRKLHMEGELWCKNTKCLQVPK